MKFSYSAIWDDAVRLFRAHSSLILAIAGVFIFLPQLLIGYLLPPPAGATVPAQALQDMIDYIKASGPWLLLARIVMLEGAAAILLLVLGRRGTTVAGALGAALAILPFYFLTALLEGLIIGVGMILLIVPGLYLLGRLATASVIVVAENRRNPIDALSRSIALTRGHGWAIVGLFMLVAIAGLVVAGAVTATLGSLMLILAGHDLGTLLVAILGALLQTALALALLLLVASIYRHLSTDSRGA